MNMRPKTFRRLLILAVITLVVVGGLTGLYLYQLQKLNHKIDQARIDGMAAVKAGDKQKALAELSFYLGKRKNDPEAMIAFANVRRTVPMDKGRHLSEAMNWYSSALQQEPNNMEAKRALLEIYPQIGFHTEAKAMADEILKDAPDDMSALHAKLVAQIGLKTLDDALVTADHMCKVDPLNFEAQATAIDLMFELKKPVAKIKERAAALLKQHPDDPRFELIQGMAMRDDQKTAVSWVMKAAGRTPPDAQFARDLARMMERAGLFSEARDYLERSVAKVDDPQILLVLVQRLWQDNKFDQVVDRLKDISPSDPSADSDLLALKALATQQLAAAVASTQPAQNQAAATQPATELTRQIVDTLLSRKNDASAHTWAMALKTLVLNPPTTAKERVAQLTAAMASSRNNGIVRYLLARANLELGESEAALTDLEAAAALMPSWDAPHLLSAHILLDTGRPADAIEAAVKANKRDPHNPDAEIVFCMAKYALLGSSPTNADVENLLDRIARLQKLFQPTGEPQTLPIYVSLLSRTGNKEAAQAAINAGLASRRPYSLDALLKLNNASRLEKLGLESAILAQAQKQYGATPALVYAQAVSLADAGKPADGLALLQSAAKANEKNLPSVQWDLPILQYRQATADPGTATAWAKLTDAYPGDLTVQNAALNAPWRYDHRDGWLKAINRLKALTNDNATGWRLEMARYVLDDPAAPDEKSLSETVNDLAAMKRQNPDAIEPRLLLATAWIRAKNIPYAITQLEEAWQLRPNDADIGLQLYDLLRKQGRLDDARSYLQRLGTSKTLDAASRVRVAAALADMGQTQRAIDLLNEEPNPGPLSDNLLARLQRRLGNEDQAAKIYARWLTAPNPDAAILQSAADFFASGDQSAQAAKYLARLPEVKLPPGRSQIILSQYQENHGSKDEAAKLLAQATALAPDDVSAWLAQAGFEIRAHRYDQAQSIAAEGLRHLPGNVDLSTLQEQAKVMAAGQSADLQPLVEQLSRDPHNAAGVATLKLLTDARSTNTADSQLLAKMRKLADQYPEFMPLQAILARSYAQNGRFDEAITIATRGEQLFPADAQAAQLTTQVYALAKRYDQMLLAAQRWRKLSAEDPVRADAAIARAQIALGDLKSASQTLAPSLAQARLEPDHHPDTFIANLYLLVASGKSTDAAQLLTPLLNDPAQQWHNTWLALATAHPTADAAVAWMDQLPPLAKPSHDDDFAAATAWFNIAQQYNRPQAYQKAKALLTQSTASPEATMNDWQMLAYVERSLGDLNAAEAAFRQVLALEPNHPDTQNNVAYLILLRKGDLAEAHKLAMAAVTASPGTVSYLDTLGRIEDKQGDIDAALATFNKGLNLEATNVDILVGKASMLMRAGRKNEVIAMAPQLDQAARSTSLAPEVAEQLRSIRKAIEQK